MEIRRNAGSDEGWQVIEEVRRIFKLENHD
jgi:hypothetical protein